MARECQHPDAKWLCSLFPIDAPLTRKGLLGVMAEQGEDPRALFIRSRLAKDNVMKQRAAELGYAPAQADWAHDCPVAAEQIVWAEKARAQGDLYGTYRLARLLLKGGRDRDKAIALFGEAAEQGHVSAQFHFGKERFAEGDWQRYRWWGRAAAGGKWCARRSLRITTGAHLKLFDQGIQVGKQKWQAKMCRTCREDFTSGIYVAQNHLTLSSHQSQLQAAAPRLHPKDLVRVSTSRSCSPAAVISSTTWWPPSFTIFCAFLLLACISRLIARPPAFANSTTSCQVIGPTSCMSTSCRRQCLLHAPLENP